MRTVTTLCLMAVVAVTGTAAAEESRVQLLTIPISALPIQKDAAPSPKGLVEAPKDDKDVKQSKPIELYKCVKVRDPDHIAPCAEHKLIEVRDPCWKPDPCVCGPQKPKLVFVSICVPKVTKCCTQAAACGPAACGRPAHCRQKCCVCSCQHKPLRHICVADGRYQKFDYGRYRVEVRVKRDHIEVDYDD